MTFRDFLTTMGRRWRIVVASVLVVVATATTVTLLRPPVYTSDVLLYVSSQGGDDAGTAYQGGLLSEQRVASYIELVDRPSVSAEVARRLDPPGDPAAVAASISASSNADSVLIDVSVTDSSPTRAAEIADAFADVFPGLVARIEAPRRPDAEPPVAVSPVEPATVPTSPSSPGLPTVLLLALLAGLVLGAIGAVLRSVLDTSITTRSRLAEVSGVAALATLPEDPSVADRPMVVTGDPHGALAEAIRTLRTNLSYLELGNRCPVFTVTSSRPGEGKTVISCNLGEALAAGGKRVLLIEADLRDPKIAAYTGLEGVVGLTTVLTGRLELDKAVQRWGDGRLRVLTSGPLPPNPSELLASEPMRQLIARARQSFDVVVVDTPPVLAVTDAAAMVPSTDGAILVCRHGRTSEAQVLASVEAISAVSARVLGTVLSRTPRSSTGVYGGYGYGHRHSTTDRPDRPRPASPPVPLRPAGAHAPAPVGAHAVDETREESPTDTGLVVPATTNGRRPDPLP